MRGGSVVRPLLNPCGFVVDRLWTDDSVRTESQGYFVTVKCSGLVRSPFALSSAIA
jgi:hypothetical protein